MHELTAKRIEAEKADKARIAGAVSAAEVSFPPFFFFLQHLQHRFLGGSGLKDS